MARDRISPLFSWRSALVDHQELSSVDRLVGLVLSMHMSERGDSCFPSLTTLERETGLSRRAVINGVQALEANGLLIVERVAQRSNRYTAVIPEGGAPDAPGAPPAPPPSAPGAPASERGAPASAPGAPESVNESVNESVTCSPPAKKRRPRDELFDAVAAVAGVDPAAMPRSQTADLARTVRDLREVGATPEQVHAARAQWDRRFPNATFTHRVLRTRWAELAPRRRQRLEDLYPDLEGVTPL